VGAFLTYGVPLTLLGASYASSVYLEPLREKKAVEIAGLGTSLLDLKEDLLGLREDISILSPNKSLTSARIRLELIVEKTAALTSEGLATLISYLLILLCELLFFPLIIAALLTSTVRGAIGASLIGGKRKW